MSEQYWPSSPQCLLHCVFSNAALMSQLSQRNRKVARRAFNAIRNSIQRFVLGS